jgi:perosamine synthetase
VIPLAAPDLSGNERKYLLEAFDSGYLTHQGTFEDRFEDEFGKWIGRPALATSSGTGALHIALLSLGVCRGDEVLLPALTFGATAAVVVQVGARPVLVDVDPDTWGINWKHASRMVNRRTRAVISVHLYGEDAGIASIGVPVIEDACESLGMVPVRGHCAAYSFYGNKPITTGEGGMLVGNLGNARRFRDGGFTPDYDQVVAGLNYRMTNLQAAVGCAQLERIEELVAKRLENARRYSEALKGRGKWLFIAECPNPVALGKYLEANGVQTRPVFRPLHLTQAFRQAGKFKHAERIWETGLALPTGPHLTQEQQEKIIGLVNVHLDLQRSNQCDHVLDASQ